jgi:DNA-binding NarL/FixJ family response regulator
MFREGTKYLLSQDPAIQVVGEAETVQEALSVIGATAPNVAVVDIRLKGGSGIDLVKAIRKEVPEVKCLALTAFDYDQYVKAMIKAGARGYLLKDAPGEELLSAIHTIHAGKAALPNLMGARVIDLLADEPKQENAQPPLRDLTARELEILEMIQQGATDRAIADHFGLSVKTVNTHVGHILLKLGEENRLQAVEKAKEFGLLKDV